MKRIFLSAILIVCFCFCLYGQDVAVSKGSVNSSAPTKKSDDKSDEKSKKEKVNEKVEKLESQVAAMRAELDELKNLLKKKLQSETKNTVAKNEVSSESVKPKTSVKAVPASSEPKGTGKNDLSFDAGDYRITPYGIIFFNAFANSNGTNNADDPLWATANQSGNSGASGRQTRLGVRITGGNIGGAKVTGVVEADFYGGFPGVGVGENMGVLRLRVAKAQFDWEKTSLIIGQDWMIFAPNNPTSLAAAAIPQFAAAGNPWSRLPQIRVEHRFGKHFKWQGAVLAPSTGDFPNGGATPALLQPSTGSASKLPFFQSRVSYANGNWFGTKKQGTIGFAGQYGQSRVTNAVKTEDIDSFGAALDWNFPISKRVTVKGEAFFGENLAGFQAGIFQGYNSDFSSLQNGSPISEIRAIRTGGGWIQLGFNLPTPGNRLTAYGSFGIDDPRNSDLITIGNRNFRSRNLGYAFDLIYVFTPQFSIGGEFRRLNTSYILGTEESSNHINLGAKYSF